MSGKLVVSVLLALASALQAGPARPARFRVLSEGRETGEADAREQVIRDAATLRAVWEELRARSDGFGPGSETKLPEVDFKTHVVVFVRLGEYAEGVEVKRVLSGRAQGGQKAQSVVTVEVQRRQAQCLSLITIMQTPYTLVEVAGTQEVVFRRVTKEVPCRGGIIPRAAPD
jgi:hypothetical protein